MIYDRAFLLCSHLIPFDGRINLMYKFVGSILAKDPGRILELCDLLGDFPYRHSTTISRSNGNVFL